MMIPETNHKFTNETKDPFYIKSFKSTVQFSRVHQIKRFVAELCMTKNLKDTFKLDIFYLNFP